MSAFAIQNLVHSGLTCQIPGDHLLGFEACVRLGQDGPGEKKGGKGTTS